MRIINFNVNKVQNTMQTIVDESEIIGCILCSEEGLLIFDTFEYNSIYNSETIAAMAASMMNEQNFGYILPDEIFLNYLSQNEKIIIRRVLCKKKGHEFLLISIVPIKMRYFRRQVNKLVKMISKNL
ncbi:MAG: hypothetical protein ACTSPY_00375 [Candidatus Helarchaeota archaeon]